MTRVVETVTPDISLGDAVRHMADRCISSLVVAEGRKPIGILTEHDVVRLLLNETSSTIPIIDVCSTPIHTITGELEFRTAYTRLRQWNVRHLVVVDESGDLTGLISETDLRSHLGMNVIRRLGNPDKFIVRDIPSVNVTDSPHRAIKLMSVEHLEFVMVLDNQHPVGIITERDLPRLLAQAADLDTLPLTEVMNTELVLLQQDQSLTEAVNLMSSHRIRHLPVVDRNGAMLGVLSQHRLLELLGLELLEDTLIEEEALRESNADMETRLEMALEVGRLGHWEYDHSTGVLSWSEPLLAVLGYAKGPPTLEAWLEHIHPDDLADTRNKVQAGMISGELHAIHRIRRGDGSYAWLETRGRVIRRDAEGKPLFSLGTAIDITEHQHALEALEHERSFLNTLIQTLPDMVWLKDPQGIYLTCNPRFEKLFGTTAANIIGKTDYDFFDKSQADFLRAHDLTVLTSAHPLINEKEVTFIDDGHVEQLETIKTPMRDGQGNLVGVLGIGRDVSHLRQMEKQYRQLFAHNPAPMLIYEQATLAMMAVNDAFLASYGYDTEDIPSLHLPDLYPDQEKLAITELASHLRGYTYVGEWHHLRKDGSPIDIIARSHDITYAGRACRVAVITDITELKRTESLIKERELSFRALTEQVPAIIYRAAIDAPSSTLYISPRISILGYTPEEWISHPSLWEQLLHPEDHDRVLREVEESQASGKALAIEYRLQTRNGDWKVIRDEATVVHNEQGHALYLQGIMLDITERVEAEARIHQLAYYDALTGLPNRTMLMDRLGQLLPVALREHKYCALVFFDIDRFKSLNDARGRRRGDAMLKLVGERLAGLLREGDTLSMFGGNQFAILLQGQDHNMQESSHHTMVVAGKIHASLQQPFLLEGDEIIISASIGITMLPESSDDHPDDVVRRAEIALHRAKSAGGNQTAFFESGMSQSVEHYFQIERELRLAIPAGELRLYLQPQVNSSGEMVSAEALVRWQHPEHGLLPPDIFIPVAEETDLIVELDNWVFREVCSLSAKQKVACKAIRLAVNISPRHFRKPDFAQWVREVVAETGADPTHLTLEVTEGLAIDNLTDVITKMTQLSMLGIHFSIDDFGTGYSSLAYLKRLPIHELKIDKSFIQDLTSDPDAAALVETILAVAKNLHLEVVAEGVETAEQAEFLNSRSKVIHQDYLFGKPEPAEVIAARCTERHDQPRTQH